MAGQYINAITALPLPPLAQRFLLAVAVAALVSVAHAQVVVEPPASVPVPQSESAQIAALMDKQQWDAALKRADAALKSNPRDAQVRFQRGVILGELGRPQDAIAAFEGLTQDFPELPEPYNNLGVLYAAQGRYDAARDALRRALLAQPGYVTAYENLGDLYIAMAVESYLQVTKLDPKNRTAPAKLALARELATRIRAVH
ncbi:MAG: tetratricopeptide repeat protein [Gemmatimonadota bacterium]